MLAEVFHIFIEFCVKLKAVKTLNAMKALQVLKALNALKVWKKLKARNHPPSTQPQSYPVEDGSPKGGMWTSPANETTHKFCKGDIRPRGQWPKC